jgi:hypothetical protein
MGFHLQAGRNSLIVVMRQIISLDACFDAHGFISNSEMLIGGNKRCTIGLDVSTYPPQLVMR